MSKFYNIFISHSWDRTALYYELIDLLNEVLRSNWYNLSISSEDAIKIQTGVSEIPQRRQFLKDQISGTAKRIEEIQKSLKSLAASLSSISLDLNELEQFRKIDMLWAEAAQRIFESDYVTKAQRLGQLQAKYAHVDVDAMRNTNIRLSQEIEEKSRVIQIEHERLLNESRKARDELRMLDVVSLKTGKERDNIMRRYPELAIAIRKRLISADIVMVIVEPYSAFRQWIEFEYQEAFVLNKRTIGILHPNVIEHMPPDLGRFGIESVKWDPIEISEVIQGANIQ